MTEEEAKAWLAEQLSVSRETMEKLDAFRRMVIEENERQNLISAGTVDQFWVRHIVDSAQVLAIAPSPAGEVSGRRVDREGLTKEILSSGYAQSCIQSEPPSTALQFPSPNGDGAATWLDLGTGAGFPGMVIAILGDSPVTFVESRRKRIDFLDESAEKLGLPNVSIHGGRLETMPPAPFSVISARAFAPLPRLLQLAHSFSTAETLWLLPKGRRAHEELDEAKRVWRGVFHVKQSLTDDESSIIVATNIQKIAPEKGLKRK